MPKPENPTPRVHTLANGVRVVCDPIPGLETVALSVVAGRGARSEDAARSGWSHLLEHMVFKGAGGRSSREIVEVIEAAGGQINAATGYERTSYQVRALAGGLDLGMAVVSDLVLRPAMDADDLAREKHVVGQEIAEAADTPDDLVFEMAQEAAFADHPLGRSILGTTQTIAGAEPASLQAWREALYAPDALVISAAGAVDEDELLALAERDFGDARAPGEAPHTPPARFEGGVRTLAKPLEQANVVFLLPAVGVRDPAYYALRLFAEILGGGMASRLFQEAREKRGLAYAVDAYSDTYADGGLLGVFLVRIDLGAGRDRAIVRVRARDGSIRARRDVGAVTAIRAVSDARIHPGDAPDEAVLETRIGDTIELTEATSDETLLGRLPVGGDRCAPRTVHIVVHVVPIEAGGALPVGVTRSSAESNVRAMIDDSNRVLAACGISLDPGTPVLRVVAPPPPHRLAIADGDGLPARGGIVTFRVDSRRVRVDIPSGSRPIATAEAIARAITAAGFVATPVELPRIDRAADRFADVLVRARDGTPATLDLMPQTHLSTDPRQRLSIGSVDFADGLDAMDPDHARTGTLEERTLLGAITDDDPSTIDVVIVDGFDDPSRSGEAFVPRDGSPFVGTVVLDRRSVAHHAATLTLAHEIAHVLFDDPFHPATSTVFGFVRVTAPSTSIEVDLPRTFTREECARMRDLGARYLRP